MKQTTELKRSPFKRKPPGSEPKKQMPRCTICKQRFEPLGKFQAKACGPDCAIELVARDKARIAAAKARKERAEDKAKLKTRSDWIKEAQSVVNKYCRLRDFNLACISCGKQNLSSDIDVWHAGHFRSVGASPGTRFNTKNIHKQCVKCNVHLSSNAIEYRKGLIIKIGLEEVEKLESINGIKKFSIDYLSRLKVIFTKKCNRIKSRL